jgi:2-polyprenyl-3-methyl-5-hydroxy-6-metoxy-1,4-benzoquinol methylase
VSDESRYAFSNARTIQRARLDALEAVLDTGTFRLLESLGVAPGWVCLEVGAGGGSVALWLADRVGPEGSVVATDLDTTLLEGLEDQQLTAQRHDVTTDDLPADRYDLIHLRLVLAWLPDAEAAVVRLVSALRPGGRLLIEEMDFISVAPDPRVGVERCELFERVQQAHHLVLVSQNMFDPFFGRRAAGTLEAAGLHEVGSEGRAATFRGGDPGGTVWRLTLAQLRDAMVDTGTVTADDVDRVMDFCADPTFSLLSQLTVAAWGRRPAGA